LLAAGDSLLELEAIVLGVAHERVHDPQRAQRRGRGVARDLNPREAAGDLAKFKQLFAKFTGQKA
jgi:hypothetical protein